MRVSDDCRTPRADVVDVANAVGIPRIRAFTAHEETRRATHRPECPHRRVHAGGNGALRALEQLVVPAHVGWSRVSRWNTRVKASAAARIASASGFPNTSAITATASAPALISVSAFAAVMPPMATTGTPRDCARAS